MSAILVESVDVDNKVLDVAMAAERTKVVLHTKTSIQSRMSTAHCTTRTQKLVAARSAKTRSKKRKLPTRNQTTDSHAVNHLATTIWTMESSARDKLEAMEDTVQAMASQSKGSVIGHMLETIITTHLGVVPVAKKDAANKVVHHKDSDLKDVEHKDAGKKDVGKKGMANPVALSKVMANPVAPSNLVPHVDLTKDLVVSQDGDYNPFDNINKVKII